MNRTPFKSFTRAGLSKTTIAVSIVSALTLTGCGSTGGALSKTSGADTAGGSHGIASTGSTGSTSTPSATSTGTASGSGSTSSSPSSAARQSATSAWDGVVGGGGNVVMAAGDTVTALGAMLMLPGGSPIAGNPVSAVLEGTGGAVYGVGSGLTSGLEGIASGGNPVDVLAPSAANASAQFGQDVSDIGSAISVSGAGLPYGSILSPTLAAFGSSVSTTGANLSVTQFEAGAMLTDGTVQQLTSAVRPLLYPTVTGAIEIVSAVGERTGLGTPVNSLVTQTGDLIAATGVQLSSASSSPVLQAAGSTVTATGATVAAVGGVVDDGQPTSIVPIAATSSAGGGILQGGMGSASLLPGGTTLLATLSSSKVTATPALTSLLSGTSSVGTPASSAITQASTAVSATASVVAAPIVAIGTALNGPVTAALTPNQSVTAVPLLSPLVAPVSNVLSGVITAQKGDAVATPLSTGVAHPGH